MNPTAQSDSDSDAAAVSVQARRQGKAVALLFTDVVGSTALKQQLGDKVGLELLHCHHELVRDALSQFAGAHEIKTAGDSFFIAFPTPPGR